MTTTSILLTEQDGKLAQQKLAAMLPRIKASKVNCPLSPSCILTGRNPWNYCGRYNVQDSMEWCARSPLP